MRAPRSVTLQPTGTPARSLNAAIALRDLVTCGFWPVIFVRSLDRAVHRLLVGNGLADAHVHRDLGDPRHLHGVRELEALLELRHDVLAVMLLQPCHCVLVLELLGVHDFVVGLEEAHAPAIGQRADADAIALLRDRVPERHVRDLERCLLLDDAALRVPRAGSASCAA